MGYSDGYILGYDLAPQKRSRRNSAGIKLVCIAYVRVNSLAAEVRLPGSPKPSENSLCALSRHDDLDRHATLPQFYRALRIQNIYPSHRGFFPHLRNVGQVVGFLRLNRPLATFGSGGALVG